MIDLLRSLAEFLFAALLLRAFFGIARVAASSTLHLVVGMCALFAAMTKDLLSAQN
jgi:hypothetical protein